MENGHGLAPAVDGGESLLPLTTSSNSSSAHGSPHKSRGSGCCGFGGSSRRLLFRRPGIANRKFARLFFYLSFFLVAAFIGAFLDDRIAGTTSSHAHDTRQRRGPFSWSALSDYLASTMSTAPLREFELLFLEPSEIHPPPSRGRGLLGGLTGSGKPSVSSLRRLAHQRLHALMSADAPDPFPPSQTETYYHALTRLHTARYIKIHNGRLPPPGYDEFVRWAADRGCEVDDYGLIDEDLEPYRKFYAGRPDKLREAAAGIIDRYPHIYGIKIRSGKTVMDYESEYEVEMRGRRSAERTEALLRLKQQEQMPGQGFDQDQSEQVAKQMAKEAQAMKGSDKKGGGKGKPVVVQGRSESGAKNATRLQKRQVAKGVKQQPEDGGKPEPAVDADTELGDGVDIELDAATGVKGSAKGAGGFGPVPEGANADNTFKLTDSPPASPKSFEQASKTDNVMGSPTRPQNTPGGDPDVRPGETPIVDWMKEVYPPLIDPFAYALPDMDIPFNFYDEPRMFVKLDDFLRGPPMTDSEAALVSSLRNRTHDQVFRDLVSGLEPSWKDWTKEAKKMGCVDGVDDHGFFLGPTTLAFVDLTERKVPMLNATTEEYWRVYTENARKPPIPFPSYPKDTPDRVLLPIFGGAKPRQCFADITLPSYAAMTYGSYPWGWDQLPAWETKDSTVYWRGTTTGGWMAGGRDWRKFHRQRLIKEWADRRLAIPITKGQQTWDGSKAADSVYFDIFLTGIKQCDDTPGSARDDPAARSVLGDPTTWAAGFEPSVCDLAHRYYEGKLVKEYKRGTENLSVPEFEYWTK